MTWKKLSDSTKQIVVSKHDRNYFIDPLGKLGGKCSTSGDQLYDYAKVYQSILGYDEILLLLFCRVLFDCECLPNEVCVSKQMLNRLYIDNRVYGLGTPFYL